MAPTAHRVLARYLRANSKRMRVFDFDDTLATSEGSVTILKKNGEQVVMDSATFAHYSPSPGDKRSFKSFNDVVKPRIIKKNFDALREAVKRGDRVAVLTARPAGAESSIKKFLKSQGIEGVDVTGVASSDPYDKARWIDKEIEKHGYDDVEFFDDSSANARAVEEHGKKHSGIHFKSHNVPHPKEEDYEGGVIEKTFASDTPTESIVEYKPKPGQKVVNDQGGTSKWWESQTDQFQKNYCRQHPKSDYCR